MIEQQLTQETEQAIANLNAELEAAEWREASLAQSLSSASDLSGTENQVAVQLRELEREAESYKELYQKFLQRYQESLQQESFPVTEARIITEAAVPRETSGPK